MEHEDVKGPLTRAPLRQFTVCTRYGDEEPAYHVVTAHLVFNNKSRGEGLVFRRYYEDSVRTEIVAEFPKFEWYKETHNV